MAMICKKCVQPDTRPGIYFKDGVCGACLYEEEKKTIDWNARQKELKDIVKWAKSKNRDYDCVIGVSGGKDSTVQAIYAKKLGLRALLVNSEPENITEIGRKNIENLKNLGFDTISLRPNPQVMKQLVKKDFYEFLNPVKVGEFSLWASAYIIADKFNIPLIIQGDNPALSLGIEVDNGSDALKIFQTNTLSTGWERYIGDDERDLFMFHVDFDSLKRKDIKAIFLQYYMKEWSPSHNAEFSIAHGLTTRTSDPNEIGTYSQYYQMDTDIIPVNQLLKYVKLGFGQCTDHACYDVRAGLINREEAMELVKKYDGKCAEKYIKQFCDYIEITTDEFWRVVNQWKKKK